MKTMHMTIDEKKATITITNVEELTQAEWSIFNSFKSAGFRVRNKRRKAKNAMHKKAYYIEKLKSDIAALAMFETICADACFATAVKWYRNEYETKEPAEERPTEKQPVEKSHIVELPKVS